MFCSNCGKQIDNNQGFCPHCGFKLGNNEILNSFSNNQNVNEPSNSIGFNRNDENDIDEAFTNPRDIIEAANNISNPKTQLVNYNIPAGMNMDVSSKKKFPWIGIAIGLVVIMVLGVVLLPNINNLLFKTYECDEYSLKYNYNWTLKEDEEDMYLYYTDNYSKIIYNASTNFSDFSYNLVDENSRKGLYKIFADVWDEVEGIVVTDGTNTFYDLDNGSIYARVDYKLESDNDSSEGIGAFYVVINQEYNSVISFMSYFSKSRAERIDKDIVKMLSSMTYGGSIAEYSKFKAGKTTKYSTEGYIDYLVPDSFSYNEEKSVNNKFKSNVFTFKDGYTLIDVRSSTVYDANTGVLGTNYEQMKDSIVKAHGQLVSEEEKIFNGITWQHVVTKDYLSNGVSFHNEIYYTLSDTGKILYYVELYVYNDNSKGKGEYLDSCVEYILNSATLHKIKE